MKLEPVNKLDKSSETTSKKLTMRSCRQIVTPFSFSQLMANLEQSGSCIPSAQSVKLIFSLILTFCLAKTENRTKKCQTQLSHYCFE